MILKSLFAILLAVTIISCNVQNIRRARLNKNIVSQTQNTQVDSFLYFQPTTLRNGFLDSLNTQFDNQISLKVRVFPPPAPPKFKQVEGYRVQIFAGLDSINALSMVYQVKGFVDDSVYFYKEKGLHKIQIGDYLYRNDADTKVYDLRRHNISSGWVVQRMINIPNDTLNTSSASDAFTGKEKPFTIQIIATSDLIKARTIVDQLIKQFNMVAVFRKSETLYKVFLGAFETREETETILQQVRNGGYKDAWLVVK